MSSVIHQPHDKFFKLSLREPPVAREFLTEHLPSTVLEKINLDTLKLDNRSFIDESYKGTEADIVYQVQTDSATAYVYLLCEQQSTVDPWMAFRLWVYITRLLEEHRRQHPKQPLPLVYPLVVYTGQERWNAPLDLFALFGDQGELAKTWLWRPFQLLDVHTIPDDEMRQRQWCGVVEFALKNKQVRDFKRFLRILLPWLRELENRGASGFSLSKNVLKYILDGTEAEDKALFIQSVRDYLSPALGDHIMTLAQQFRLEGEVTLMTQLLRHRFNQIPETYMTQIQQADAETLLKWGEKIFDAETLDEVFQED